MKYLIILEGPDCTGKTTLSKFTAQYLQKRGGAIYLHADGSFPGLLANMEEYQTSLLRNAVWNYDNLDVSVVIDRLWPSNVVYGSVFNNQRIFDATKMCEELEKRQVIYIWCCDPGCVERFMADRHHDYNSEQFRQVVSGYHELFNKSELFGKGANIHQYDVSEWGADMRKFLKEEVGLE